MNKDDKYTYTVCAEPDNSYTLTFPELKTGYKYKFIKTDKYSYRVVIVKSLFDYYKDKYYKDKK